jgi:hypothetical protein
VNDPSQIIKIAFKEKKKYFYRYQKNNSEKNTNYALHLLISTVSKAQLHFIKTVAETNQLKSSLNNENRQ